VVSVCYVQRRTRRKPSSHAIAKGEEIRTLKEQQIAVEKTAGLVGMTTHEAERYSGTENGIIELKA
jgi:hypothetical protein